MSDFPGISVVAGVGAGAALAGPALEAVGRDVVEGVGRAGPLAGVRWQAVAFLALETVVGTAPVAVASAVPGGTEAGQGLADAPLRDIMPGNGALLPMVGEPLALGELPVLGELVVPDGAVGARLAVLAAWHRMVPLEGGGDLMAEALPVALSKSADSELKAAPAGRRAEVFAGFDADADEALTAEPDADVLRGERDAPLPDAPLPVVTLPGVVPEAVLATGSAVSMALPDGAELGDSGLAARRRDSFGLLRAGANGAVKEGGTALVRRVLDGPAMVSVGAVSVGAVSVGALAAVRVVAAAVSRLLGAAEGKAAAGGAALPVLGAAQPLVAVVGEGADGGAALLAGRRVPVLAGETAQAAGFDAGTAGPDAGTTGPGDALLKAAGAEQRPDMGQFAGQNSDQSLGQNFGQNLGRERGAVLAGRVFEAASGQAIGAASGGHVLGTDLGPVRIVVEGEAAALRVTLTTAETAVAAFEGARAALAAALQVQGMRLETLAVRVEAALQAGGDVSADASGREGASAAARDVAGGQDFGRGGGSAGERAALARAAAGFVAGSGAAALAVDDDLARGRPAERFA